MQGGMEQSAFERLAFSDFLTKVNNGEVASVTIKRPQDAGATTISGFYSGNGARFVTYAPDYPDLVGVLNEKKVKIEAQPEEITIWSVFLSVLPLLLIIG